METRIARLGLAVIKLQVATQPYYLMRLNPKWKDVNFIGGHEKKRDSSSLQKTAQRELWEEVPSIRAYSNVNLDEITEPITYGPVFSKSRGDQVIYEIQYFSLRLADSPRALVSGLSARSRNVWLNADEIALQSRYRVSMLVSVLVAALPGGLSSIPFSSRENLDDSDLAAKINKRHQFELELK